nr:MAG TPA: hypothetical protein [Caudoviricetes sp.]
MNFYPLILIYFNLLILISYHILFCIFDHILHFSIYCYIFHCS